MKVSAEQLAGGRAGTVDVSAELAAVLEFILSADERQPAPGGRDGD